MAAAKKNKYAQKWTPDLAIEFLSLVEQEIERGSYFKDKAIVKALKKFRTNHPEIKAKAHDVLRYLGKERFKDNEEVLTAIKKVETLLEGKIVEDTLRGEIKSAPMAIFYLKNKFGWKDKSEQDINLHGSIAIEKWLEAARDDQG